MRPCRLFKAIVIMGCSLGAAGAGCDAPQDGGAGGTAKPSYGVGHPGSLDRGGDAGLGSDGAGEDPHGGGHNGGGGDVGSQDAGGLGGGDQGNGAADAVHVDAGDTRAAGRGDVARHTDGTDHDDLGDQEDGWHTTK